MNETAAIVSYRFEHEMTPALAAAAPAALFDSRRRDGLVSLQEVAGLEAVPDVTVLRIDAKRLAERQEMRVEPLSTISEADLILALQRRPRNIRSLPSAIGVSRSQVCSTLIPTLEEKGWIFVDGVEIGLRGRWHATAQRIVTIEAKLRDWRRATWQARTQQWSADAAYVCLDDSRSRAARTAQAEIAATGVGLMTLNRATEKLTIVHRATPTLSPRQRARGRLLLQERAITALRSPGTVPDSSPVFGWTPTAS